MSDIENEKANGNELPEEIRFDYSRAKRNRFAERLKDQQILIALFPDVAAMIGNAETVNRVLRALIETMPGTSQETA